MSLCGERRGAAAEEAAKPVGRGAGDAAAVAAAARHIALRDAGLGAASDAQPGDLDRAPAAATDG